MNQILVTKDKTEVSSKDMRPVLKFFCIACIIFAIILVVEGVIHLVNNSNKNVEAEQPKVVTEQSGSSAIVQLIGKEGISKFVYSWNDGVESVLDGKGEKDAKFEIEMPQGKNILKGYIVYVKGGKAVLDDMTFVYDASIDTTKPVITLENVGGKLSVTATDDVEISYLTYQWEGGEEVKINVNDDDKKVINQSIDVKKGTSRIIIKAVDASGNENSVNKKVIGSDGPKIDVKLSNGNFIITVTDEFKITKIEYTLNDKVVEVKDIPKDAKEYKLTVPVIPDEDNYLKVNAYEDNIMTEVKKKKSK